MSVIEYKNIFSKLDIKNIYDNLANLPFYFNGTSNSNTNDFSNDGKYTFWNCELNENTIYTKYFLNKIEKISNKKFKLNRVYVNAALYGTPGYPHTDDEEPNTYTFLYYLMNEKWDVRWGGKTCFDLSTETENKYMFIVPEYNKGVLFESSIVHWAEDVNRDYKGIRMTIAWKLKEI